MNVFKQLTATLLCSFGLACYAATPFVINLAPQHHQNAVTGQKLSLRQKQPGKRPNAPSRVFIDCYYADGVIEFAFPDGTSALDVSIANDSGLWVATVTPELPALLIDGITGNITIECTAPDGRTFIGNIIL